MTFSNRVKQELLEQTIDNITKAKAELYTIYRVNALFRISSDESSIIFSSESQYVSERISKLIYSIYKIEPSIIYIENDHIRKNGIYEIRLTDDKFISDLLEINLFNENEDEKYRINNIYPSLIRGAFMGTGSLVDPNKNYHMEFVLDRNADTRALLRALSSMGIKSSVTKRRDRDVVYIKGADMISELLIIMEANTSMLEMENVMVMKELRNNINRQVNCDTANINKTITASQKQIEQINYIEESVGLDQLPKNVKEVALLRLDHPEYSLKQLGESLNPPLSKSGVSHRMNKIKDLYENLKG